MNPTAPRLSQSRFLSGLPCHQRLYLESHAPQLATVLDAQHQSMLDMRKDRVAQSIDGDVARCRDHRRLMPILMLKKATS